jgi:uncharacterized protein YjiS (DUF1127 family)
MQMNISENPLLFFVGKQQIARKISVWPFRLQARIGQIVASWMVRRKQAREARDLLNFSDRELWDIGLGRSDVQSIIDGTYRRD